MSEESLTEILMRHRLGIEAALFRGGNAHNFDDVVRMVLTSKAFFYETPDQKSFAIMEKHTFSNYSTFHVFLASGDLDSIKSLTPLVGEDAIAIGCAKLTLTGRKGFARALRNSGWRVSAVHMEMDLPMRMGLRDDRDTRFNEDEEAYG